MTPFKDVAEAWIASREHCTGSIGRIKFWVDQLGDRLIQDSGTLKPSGAKNKYTRSTRRHVRRRDQYSSGALQRPAMAKMVNCWALTWEKSDELCS